MEYLFLCWLDYMFLLMLLNKKKSVFLLKLEYLFLIMYKFELVSL